MQKCPHVVIVGGGAGGIELAAKLGRKYGKRRLDVTLVDATMTHVWKPLLHEIAAGTLNSYDDEVNYITFAYKNNFHFVLGTLVNIDRAKKEIILAPLEGSRSLGNVPSRRITYDVLVIAVGSIANDFNIEGAKEYCSFLDNDRQAENFHLQLVTELLRLSTENTQSLFNIGVVGGGATGIELIAELHSVIRLIAAYGLKIKPEQITFSLIEASEKLLPDLPKRLSQSVVDTLEDLHVQLYTGERVVKVNQDGFFTASGKFIPANLKVWCAGIKAPDFLAHLDDLETNRINQLVVKTTLQTTLDPAIFAFGDCASCPRDDKRMVPPRAQAAHQQANFLVKSILLYLQDKNLPQFKYHDYGSLVTLSHYETVGNLMSRMTNLIIEGKIARLTYLSLYKRHQSALYGFWRTFVLTLGNILSRPVRPRLKLH